MQTSDSKSGYGIISMINHWTITIAVTALIIVGLTLTGMENSPEKTELRNLHKASGVLVLILAIWRTVWRLKEGFPDPSPDHPQWQIKTAKYMHWFLLFAVIAMPLSGLFWSLFAGRPVSVYGLFSIPALPANDGLSSFFEMFHRLFSKALIAGILIHSLAGAYHAFTTTGKGAMRMFTPR